MLLGRNAELQTLEELFNEGKSTLTILYGRTNIGKTSLLREFIKNKKYVYYLAPQASKKEQFAFFKRNVRMQLGLCEEPVNEFDSYGLVLKGFEELVIQDEKEYKPVKVLIIEEFQNIVKNNKEFMNAVSALIKGEMLLEKVMIICTSSSISWIENDLVSSIGSNAYSISAFVKVKELSFIDTVRCFSKYTVEDCVRLYAVTGGVPGYMAKFSDSRTFKENVCNVFLRQGAPLKNEGIAYIKEELRETSLYNTILYCIANGEYKLNELYEHTGFGRDKISVYLKNLMEREIVEKIFSYDTNGNEHTRKGLYRIKSNIVEFWFRYIYAGQSELDLMEPELFYDKFIANSIDVFASNTFVKVGTEFIELMQSVGKLPIEIDRQGRWWGKDGDIDIIACDEEKKYVIGKCNWSDNVFQYSMYEELMENVKLADIGCEYVYLFSRGTFDEALVRLSKEDTNLILVGIEDL